VQGEYGACFCSHGTKLIECWRFRGIRFISDKVFAPVQDVLDEHWRALPDEALRSRGRGTSYYKSVMGAGAKAKTVTSL
jgi:hypothetical protein